MFSFFENEELQAYISKAEKNDESKNMEYNKWN